MFKDFFKKWLAAFDSKKFKALAMGFAASILVLALSAVVKATNLPISDEMLTTAIEWVLTGIFGSTATFTLAQAYADAKTDGKTSGTAQVAFTQAVKEAVSDHLKKSGPGGPPIAPPSAGYAAIKVILSLTLVALIACAALQKVGAVVAGAWVTIGDYECRVNGALSLLGAAPKIGVECRPAAGVTAQSASAPPLAAPSCAVTMVQ